MSVVTLPANLYISRMTWGQKRNDMEFRSIFGAQAAETAAPLWTCSIEVDQLPESASGPWKALMMQLRGKVNQVAVFDVARQSPRGTIGLVPVAFQQSASTSAGATAITVNGGYAAAGLGFVAGDLLGFGSGVTQQVVMVTADSYASSETRSLGLDFTTQSYQMGMPGDITLNVMPPLRNAMPASTPIVTYQPTALFRVAGSGNSIMNWSYQSTFASGFQLDLVEDIRP